LNSLGAKVADMGGLKKAYTATFRAEMVRRMSGPGAATARALSRETGIGQATLSLWLRSARTLSVVSDVTGKTPLRSPEEKLRLVVQSIALEGEELGAFLRREGVHEVELRDWRKAMLDGLGGGRAAPLGTDAKVIKNLEKELRRKDRALAEIAALVVLKKKAQALGLLEPEDDGMDPSSGRKS
jgi:transposase-like protein